ncbi:MAG TPA: DUF2293 domain-containing protein [Acidimicrobiales bacterium]|nr:DUF2293 domain-containing protein [Acidimicrobiales bacterium]
MPERRPSLEDRVVRVAEAALAERSVVSPIDVLIGLGWLTPQAVDAWRQGRADDLERLAQANLHKLSAAMAVLRRWAADRGLRPSETAYVARTRDRRPLRFSRSGDAAVEAAYRTHWVAPDLSEAKQRRLTERQSASPDLVVISPLRDWSCTACDKTGDLLIMEGPGPLCLGCADLDHLVFLAAGDAALTRRAKTASGLSAVVVRFSRSRRRYERQGVLVEEEALEQAEQACLADEDARERRRLREEQRRTDHDVEFQASFARTITELFPRCPPGRAEDIAHRAGARRSGRVGRSAAGRALDPEAVTLAVVASVRHVDSPYDRLLMAGVSRADARRQVADEVKAVVDSWRFAIVR